MIDTAVIGGGQAGLATAHALLRAGRTPVVLEAGAEPVGSWPFYYDSLTLFSPARYSALPGMAFDGDPDRYPRRDEVVDYLRRYASGLDADIRTHHRVDAVRRAGDGFVLTVGGREVRARRVIAATGSFGRPHRPALADGFTGTLLHAAGYREPTPFAGRRVVVVGAGNSAVQIAVELAGHARVTLATRVPVRFVRQRPWGRDVHFWITATGVDFVPVGRLLRNPPHPPVLDRGHQRAAFAAGLLDRRPVFTRVDGDVLTWADGTRERVDAIVLATGYRPALSYLDGLGALDGRGRPVHRSGLSTVVPGLGFVGVEWQRTLGSATVRGVGRDARHVVRRLPDR
ncbi:ArsO family NAD(P)H-dependent flavin-containing monooxygenase [Saccharothrix violaceirubra]|uniref:Putative flavoprotein involved in K+ transport n=1 Tax=Saccharothrix violaceirubra TaxID=413306 RepID=A0A7W7T4E1_9PSEU|nr:NAD(P)/FAD-dependent oxidoreductase [Saccharothrix violaceirubra]MBB4965832.1 putative flavoprotein involved in K+ transport [Saccharothrix violaceirubra]